MTLVGSTFREIFNSQELAAALARPPKGKRRTDRMEDLKLAVVVLLVDLATCDQQFDEKEYQAISAGLRRIFHLDQRDIGHYVQAAQAALGSLRGIGAFTSLIRDECSPEQRNAIMHVVNEVIAADGREDDFEVYLRHKLAKLLNVPSTPPATSDPLE